MEMLDTTIEFPITYTDIILNRLKDVEILSKSFTDQVQLTIRSINDDYLLDLNEITRGQLKIVSQTIIEVERKFDI